MYLDKKFEDDGILYLVFAQNRYRYPKETLV